MSTMPYPLLLRLERKRVLVVGGGPVAARRVRGMLDALADVFVVAPVLGEELTDQLRSGAITWYGREFLAGDTAGAWLVHTATGDRHTDDAVAQECDATRVWCVRADDSARSSAWTPAVAHGEDGLLVAVSGGGDPGRSIAIRNAVSAALDSGSLPIRPTRHRKGKGIVHLVGGGPGDDGLLTVRGRKLLAQADVVVVDRLAPRGVLTELADDVEIVDVGKTPRHHTMPQDEINALLVERAQRGLRVVRLKGGDPFVLGRGGEEALACIANGVQVEVVPGVTSAVSVPAAAGIPVTHRGITSSFAMVSSHDDIDPVVAAAAAHAPSTTLVLLMGVRLLGQACEALIAAGRADTTPVAVIENGWTSSQRTTVGTLSTITAKAESAEVKPPAVVVVGQVVNLRAQLGPFSPENG
jgi:uroporphyrin-III C-methyltransferase/precorrin-2 dehydrogenase/sirohydrochlorin ferrochelatase